MHNTILANQKTYLCNADYSHMQLLTNPLSRICWGICRSFMCLVYTLMLQEKLGYRSPHMSVKLDWGDGDYGALLVQQGLAQRGDFITDLEALSAHIQPAIQVGRLVFITTGRKTCLHYYR